VCCSYVHGSYLPPSIHQIEEGEEIEKVEIGTSSSLFFYEMGDNMVDDETVREGVKKLCMHLIAGNPT